MQEAGIQACLIPSTDPHQSEYVAERWQVRAHFSGFTGSAGELLVTLGEAALWTDSRYFLQAEQQLAGSEIQLMKSGLPETPSLSDWLAEQLQQGDTLGINGWQFPHSRVRSLRRKLAAKGIELRTDFDPFDEIWPQRPPLPKEPIFDFPTDYAGESREHKLQRLRENMQKQGASQLLISALDEIAWLFNLRGRDVHCNPVFYAYALVGQDEARLFLPYSEEGKCPDQLGSHLAKAGIKILPYEQIADFLHQLAEGEQRLWAPETQTNEALFEALGGKPYLRKNSPLAAMKAIKNEREIELLREAMIMDGKALKDFYQWLEETLQERPVSEYEAGEKINEFRSRQEGYFGPSFDPIVGFRQNGAIVHYRAEADSCAMIEGSGMLLIDSGGQYLKGTTDITRTIYLGEPSEEEKRHFTLVLKGTIALAMARFPEGTTGCQLDTLARKALWSEKLNYGHGTGHGVGFFLNVHEGPQRIGPTRSNVPLQPGMITSDEPGYYREGHYGIRIENLILCKSCGDGFLEFETLTLFPIQRKLIVESMLTEEEREWLEAYERKVAEALA